MVHDAARSAPQRGARTRLDHPVWCRWWRDLIVERYRVAAFAEVVPLVDGDHLGWARRVALGRLVDAALAGPHGAGSTGWLVADALDAAGFGVAGEVATTPRSLAADRLRVWAPPRLGNEDLQFGVLGTIADALLTQVPPIADLDLRAARSPVDGTEDPEVASLDATIVGATRSAVLAYGSHVEGLACRARASVATTATVSLGS